eukprot:528463-Pyramimonas_sp.AAC.1
MARAKGSLGFSVQLGDHSFPTTHAAIQHGPAEWASANSRGDAHRGRATAAAHAAAPALLEPLALRLHAFVRTKRQD